MISSVLAFQHDLTCHPKAFADDLAILAPSMSELQKAMNNVESYFLENDLVVNAAMQQKQNFWYSTEVVFQCKTYTLERRK